MNLLAIVREHAKRQGLPIPSSVIASGNDYCQQAQGLLNEFCDDLNTRKMWQANVRATSWAAIAAESQGGIETLAPDGYEGIIPGTTYDGAQRRMMETISPQEWTARKACNFVGPYVSYRLMGGNLLLNPIPTAGETYSFEYYSSYFIYFPGTTSSPPTYRKYWENDLDTSTVDSALAIAYLRWAWKKEKGLDYAEDFAKYERMLATKSFRDSSPQAVSMEVGVNYSAHPGIIVPQASWNLP